MFEHEFLPLINAQSLDYPPPPPHNDRVFDQSAMLAFPQEKISHYTTSLLHKKCVLFSHLHILEKYFMDKFTIKHVFSFHDHRYHANLGKH